jgi:glycosyltransferase involved in cell wall biosynthesis
MIEKSEMLGIPAQEISDSESLCPQPLVSVLMMTCNHSQYIEQAVESVMVQQCGFDFEVLIGEDYSADNTRAACEVLQRKYPEKIRLIVADRNVGITGNFLRLVSRARGKYCAFLEGDDYWTAADKLQKQVDLMEAHQEYAWCGAGAANRIFWAEKKPSYTIEDVLSRYLIHTSTVMFRTGLLSAYPRFPDRVCWESMLMGYLTEQGVCGFIDEEVSYYRRHEGGLWHNAERMKKIAMSRDCIDALNAYFGGRFRRKLADREVWIYRMDVTSIPETGALAHWRQSFSVLLSGLPRVLVAAPTGYLLLWMAWLFQPAGIPLMKARRSLGLRGKLRAVRRLFGAKGG